MSLKSRAAVITGSTSGIGLAYARALAAEGCNVVINGFGDKDAVEKERAGIEKDFGGVPDFALYNARYAPPIAHEAVADGDEFPKVSRRMIEGVTVRYVEEHDAIRVVFEGALTDAVMELVVEDLRAKLAKLEGAECQRKRLR